MRAGILKPGAVVDLLLVVGLQVSEGAAVAELVGGAWVSSSSMASAPSALLGPQIGREIAPGPGGVTLRHLLPQAPRVVRVERVGIVPVRSAEVARSHIQRRV